MCRVNMLSLKALVVLMGRGLNYQDCRETGERGRKTATTTRGRLENWIIISLLQIAQVLQHFIACGDLQNHPVCAHLRPPHMRAFYFQSSLR